MRDDKAPRAHLMIGDARVELDGGLVGFCEHPKIELGESASFSLTVDAEQAHANFLAATLATMMPYLRPPMHIQVAEYSEADAMLGRATARGELVGGDVADAYAWAGLRVTGWLPIGPGVILYTLRDAIEWRLP